MVVVLQLAIEECRTIAVAATSILSCKLRFLNFHRRFMSPGHIHRRFPQVGRINHDPCEIA